MHFLYKQVRFYIAPTCHGFSLTPSWGRPAPRFKTAKNIVDYRIKPRHIKPLLQATLTVWVSQTVVETIFVKYDTLDQ